MIKSMTGFGRASEIRNGLNITFEIKSVNHRYFEFYSRIPYAYGFLEEKLKNYIKNKVARGKIECYLQIEELEANSAEVSVNKSLASGYVNALNDIADTFGISNDISAVQIARFQDVLMVHRAEADEDAVWNSILPCVEKAVNSFIAMREKEGEKLKDDILSRCGTILKNVAFIEARSPETVREYNERLTAKIEEVLAGIPIDEARILTESAIYADKIAVDEETVRLRSHISQLDEYFDSADEIGKKMNFLVQEMNREANTIGSKCQDVEITKKVLDIKSEIEKIREQIQNIE